MISIKDQTLGALRNVFSDIRYVEEYPDVAKAIRQRVFQNPFEHFVHHGLLEKRKLFVEPEEPLPLFIAALFWFCGQTDDAAAVYQTHLSQAVGVRVDRNRPSNPRFNMWSALLHWEQGVFEGLIGAHPPTDHPMDETILWPLVEAHYRIEAGEVRNTDVVVIQRLFSKITTRIAEGLMPLLAVSVLRMPETDVNLPLMMHSVYALNSFDVVDIVAAQRLGDPGVRAEIRHAYMIRHLRYGDHQAVIDLAEATSELDSFSALLAGVAHLELIEGTYFTDRGVRCAANVAALEGISSMLQPFLDRSALANYVEGRTAHLLGHFEGALTFLERAAELAPQFVHARASCGEAQLYAADVESAERSLRMVFERTFSSEAMNTLTYYRRWIELDHEVCYVDKVDFDIVPMAPIEVFQDPVRGCSRGVALADHDFAIGFEIVPHSVEWDYPVFNNKTPYVLSLDVDGGGLVLRIGDSSVWIKEVFLGRLRVDHPIRVFLLRRGQSLEVVVDGRLFRHLVLPVDFWLRGETYRFCWDQNPILPRHFSAGARFWIEKYNTGSDAKRLRLLSVFWGQTYARMFNETLIPSLLKLSRLDRIAEEYDTVVELIVPDKELRMIRDTLDGLARDLPVRLEVRSGLLSSDHNTNVGLLHGILPRVWQEHEVDGCVTLMAQPDHVFGTGLLEVIRANGPNDYTVVGHPRVDTAEGFPAIAAALARGELRSNEDLVAVGPLRHPHVTFSTGLNFREHWLRARRVSDRFEVYFKEPPPLCLRVRKDILSIFTGEPYGEPFEQIDHDIVELVYRQERLRVVDDSRKFFWTEFSHNTKNSPTIRNSYWSAAARSLSRTKLTWWLPASAVLEEVVSSERSLERGKPRELTCPDILVEVGTAVAYSDFGEGGGSVSAPDLGERKTIPKVSVEANSEQLAAPTIPKRKRRSRKKNARVDGEGST